jgi:hypothetical protein
MSTISAVNTFEQIGHVRLVASANQTGTYYNGPTNNGVGATFTYASGALTIDSVAVVLGDRILFSAQTSTWQNGIYVVTQAGATGVAAILTRAGDFQSIEQIRGGHYVFVKAGTVAAGSAFVLVEPLPAGIGAPAVANQNDILFGSAAVSAGIGTLAAQNANAVSITGGTITGLSAPLPIASGGTNAITAPLALTSLGVKRAITAAYAGGGTSNAFVATGLAATDIVVATILTSTNSVSINKAVPTLNTLTITFSADPGAATTVQWHAVAP